MPPNQDLSFLPQFTGTCNNLPTKKLHCLCNLQKHTTTSLSQLIEISYWINLIDHPKKKSFLLSHYDLSFNVYLLCEASLLVTIIVTGPVLMFLNIDIASLWDIPCTDIPLTDNTSSPKIRHPLYKVLFLEFVLF